MPNKEKSPKMRQRTYDKNVRANKANIWKGKHQTSQNGLSDIGLKIKRKIQRGSQQYVNKSYNMLFYDTSSIIQAEKQLDGLWDWGDFGFLGDLLLRTKCQK